MHWNASGLLVVVVVDVVDGAGTPVLVVVVVNRRRARVVAEVGNSVRHRHYHRRPRPVLWFVPTAMRELPRVARAAKFPAIAVVPFQFSTTLVP